MITKNPKEILIADDSLFFRVKLSEILIEAGHSVRLVNDGLEAIKEIEANSDDFDLLILDVHMPGASGFEVLKWLKEKNLMGAFPVLSVTGAYDSENVINELKGLGAKGFMSKNISPEEVLRRVNVLLFMHESRNKPEKKRVIVFMPVDFSVGDMSSTGMALNISEDGLFLNTTEEIPDGSLIDIKFTLPNSSKVINAKTLVKWSPELQKKDSMFYGYGLHFVMIDAQDRQDVKVFVTSSSDNDYNEKNA